MNRKNELFWFFLLIFFCFPVQAVEKNIWQERFERDWPEYLMIAGVYGADFLLQKTPTWQNDPLIGGLTNYPLRPETVSTLQLATSLPIALTGILTVPVNNVFISETNYQNSKGFIKATGLTILITDLTKKITGRRRPDYDERFRLNQEIEEGNLSFFSGHAAVSFSTATYLSLYAFEHFGEKENPYHLLGKALFSSTLIGLAGWVSATRISDNRHHPEDVLIGALVGTGVSLGVYALENEWFTKEQRFSLSSDSENLLKISFRW